MSRNSNEQLDGPIADGRNVHGACCHACLFAPETSCERGNRFLDRSSLATTFAARAAGTATPSSATPNDRPGISGDVAPDAIAKTQPATNASPRRGANIRGILRCAEGAVNPGDARAHVL